MGGSAWIKAGSSPGTSGAMCLSLFPGPEWPSGGAIGPPGQLMVPYASFMAFGGPFGPFQSPPMALTGGFKGSNTSAWMCPA